jgi:GH15 family glucan-1,4-alpha-glucosidase
LVEALAIAGRSDEANELFEKLVDRANDLGLYSEEIDRHTGALRGNFPQALTHIGFMNAAICLNEKMTARSQRTTGK